MFKISIFSKIYEACIGAARHKFASIFLAIFSFIESFFWPIPTDVVLAPMCLAKPNRALLYALNATVTSVLGAVVGYYIGYWLSTAFVKEFFESVNMIGTFNTVNEYLNEFGILFILIGSFTPVPYKVVAICCGVAASDVVIQSQLGISTWQLNIFVFIAVSLFGRGARFFLVAILLKLGGEKMEQKLHKYIDIIGIICVVVAIIAIICYILFK